MMGLIGGPAYKGKAGGKGKAKPGRMRPKPMPDTKGIQGLAGAMNAMAAAGGPPQAAPLPPGPPSAPVAPMAGATDGLGAGAGGLAVHPSLRGFAIHGREPRHSSKTR